MKAPVTSLACFTSPNEMILCPCNRVGDRDTDRMNQPAGLLSEYYGRRPVRIVCAHFPTPRGCAHGSPAECSSLPWQAASRRLQENKQPIITTSNHSITSCGSAIQKTQSPWLPCCQETVQVGLDDVSEKTEMDRGKRDCTDEGQSAPYLKIQLQVVNSILVLFTKLQPLTVNHHSPSSFCCWKHLSQRCWPFFKGTVYIQWF